MHFLWNLRCFMSCRSYRRRVIFYEKRQVLLLSLSFFIFKFKESKLSFKKSFISFLRILLLILICVGASILLVFPLWKFATAAPKIYTITVLALTAAFIIYSIIKKILVKTNKKNRATTSEDKN